MASSQSIPVLDLRQFAAGGGERSQFIAQLGNALEEIGFFALTHHGVEAELIEAAYGAAEQFFSLPDATKQQYEIAGWNGQRGFTRFGREHAKDHPVADLKEFWHVGREGATVRNGGAIANLPVAEVPQFQPLMLRLYAQLETCAIELLRACALYLGQPDAWLAEQVQQSDTILRIIHYPPIPPNAHPASLRAAPHEDINLITLLCGATADGLELLQRDGTWLPIAAMPGHIIVDSGDMLQQLTNGILRSTTHRVVNGAADNSHARRFSMPFFVHPRPEVDLTPLPECVARVGEQRFPAITAGEYLLQRLREIGLVG
jgi:isopenicillin N synthase-like dioxygenase